MQSKAVLATWRRYITDGLLRQLPAFDRFVSPSFLRGVMSSFAVTLIITIVLVGLAIAGLAIGLILTGKSKLRRGSCGLDPTKLRDNECDKEKSCNVCSKGGAKSDDDNA